MDRSGEFYVVGGYHAEITRIWRTIQKLDLNKESPSWIILQNLTIPAHLGSTHQGLIIYNKRLYIFSGQLDYGCGPATRACAYLNLSTYEWVNLPDIPEARYTPQVFIFHNHIHLFGGAKPDRAKPAFDYWTLNLDHLDRGWLNGSSLPESGDHGQGVRINDWIYFTAFEHEHTPLNINHTGIWDGKQPVYCPGMYIAKSDTIKINTKNTRSSSQWIQLSNIPNPVSHASSVVLNNQFILVIGGIGPTGDRPVPHIQLFDSHLNQWHVLSPLIKNAKSPLLWTTQDQSILYLQHCLSSTVCLNQQAHIIWSYKAKKENCLFYTHLNCTTRKLERTPYEKYRRVTEIRWNNLFSQIYLMNMRTSIDRLRQTWYQLNRMDLTSITLFEAFQIQNIANKPVLINKDLLWPLKMKMWKEKNDTNGILYYIRSSISIKFIFMNLWTRNIDDKVTGKPLLILEDDVIFLRSKVETREIVEQTLNFLHNHPEIEWDLLYLSYRDIEATRTHQVSQSPSIYLWLTSQVFSNTAYIVNKNPRTIKKLNECYLNRLDTADRAICYCLKHQWIRAYLIEPKLAQAIPGFSLALNHFQDYEEYNEQRHMLNNYTKPSTFNLSTGYWLTEK